MTCYVKLRAPSLDHDFIFVPWASLFTTVSTIASDASAYIGMKSYMHCTVIASWKLSQYQCRNDVI